MLTCLLIAGNLFIVTPDHGSLNITNGVSRIWMVEALKPKNDYMRVDNRDHTIRVSRTNLDEVGLPFDDMVFIDWCYKQGEM